MYTDHKNLVSFTTTKELNRRQVRWAETLATFNFKISYVKGTENGRADALSRKAEYQGNDEPPSRAILKEQDGGLVFNGAMVATVSRLVDNTLEQRVKSHYDKDIFAKTSLKGTSGPFTTDGGILRFNDKLYIPLGMQKDFIREQHELPAHGHQGIAKTVERISRGFFIQGLQRKVTEVVGNCDTCIRNKASRHAPYGQMRSPHTPPEAWKSIAWDFVVKLPPSKEPVSGVVYDAILVITDRNTKYAYMLPYLEASTAEDLAYTFLRIVVANHGVPDEIISDRDKLFTSKFWTTLTALLGIKQKVSTAFHPQTDGQTERLNQVMETYLRCYVNYQQNNWAELLPLAQFSYNSATTESTKVSPFFANYGYEPKAYQHPCTVTSEAQDARIQVDRLKSLRERLAEDIQFVAARSAMYYNKHRSMEPTLKEGGKVYLIRRNIKTKRPSDKLDHKKLGPYKIKKVKGPVNYELDLPSNMNIHPVFHISLLEPAPPGAPRAPRVEIEPVNPKAEYEVEEILDCQYVRKQVRYLIKWQGYPHSENTWEPKRNLSCPEKLEAFHRQNPGLPRKQGLRPGRPDQGPRTDQSRRKR